MCDTEIRNAASQKKKGEKGRSKLRNEEGFGGKKLPALVRFPFVLNENVD